MIGLTFSVPAPAHSAVGRRLMPTESGGNTVVYVVLKLH